LNIIYYVNIIISLLKKLKLKYLKKKRLNILTRIKHQMSMKLEKILSKIDKIELIPPQKNERVNNQLLSTPKFDGKNIDIELPPIKMTHGGFPQKGNPLYETFLQRANGISIPIQKNDEIYNFLEKLQEYIVENIKNLIPEDKSVDEIIFQDIIREYENKKKDIIEYSFKARLALDIKDIKTEKYEVITSIWKKETKTSKPVLVETATVEEVEKNIRYGSEIRLIIRPNKLYISTKNEGTKKEPKYKMGITFKIMQVCINSNQNSYNTINYKKECAFEDEEEDEVSEAAAGPTINMDGIDSLDINDD